MIKGSAKSLIQSCFVFFLMSIKDIFGISGNSEYGLNNREY